MDGEVRTLEEGLIARLARRLMTLLSRRRQHRPVHYGGTEFSPPKLLSEAMLPSVPGIYVIQVPHWWYGLQPIHFGASRNLREELMVEGSEGFVSWLMHRGARRGLFVSFRQATGGDHEGHHRECVRLTRHCFPNRTHSVDEHLAGHRLHRVSPHRQRYEGSSDTADLE